MERQVFIAVLLSFLVLYAWQALVVPPAPPPLTDAQTQAGRPGARDAAVEPPPAPLADYTTPAAPSVPTAPGPGRLTAVPPADPDPIVGAAAPRDIVVESDVFRAVFSNRGAELVSWTLKDYLEEGRPVELVPRDLPPEEPWPFSVAFEDEGITALADAALFRSSATSLRLTERRMQTLTFDFEDQTGLRIRKAFSFDPSVSPYLFRLTVDATQGGQALNPTIRWGPALGGVESTTSGFAYRQGPRGLLMGRVLEGGVLSDVEVTRPNADDVAVVPSYTGALDFVGVDNHYFIAVALPSQAETSVRYRSVPLLSAVPDGDPRELMAFDLSMPTGIADLQFYIGPKDFDILKAASPPLVESIEFGWLAVLVVPLHLTLSWVQAWIGNWGFSIIAVTVIVNLLIFPLRYKSITSMRKMQEIQPEMKAIQDRYKHLKATDPDKQKMNQEVMALYRDRGVNPVSGCLPMVLTMPILFAFYRLLSMAIELRNAPFIGWITDLSAHDPLYVTPLIMGVSMFVQQKMTPSQADPMQQRIMMMMPVMFTFMFLWAPSGLVIYWLTSNLIHIGQTLATNKIMGPPRAHTVRPAAERRTKAAKSAKRSTKKG